MTSIQSIAGIEANKSRRIYEIEYANLLPSDTTTPEQDHADAIHSEQGAFWAVSPMKPLECQY